MTTKNLKPFTRSLIRRLGSRKLSIYIMSGLVLLFLIWLLPFQIYGVPKERVQTMATTTWFFRVMYAALLVNQVFCLIHLLANLPAKLRRQPPDLQTNSTPDGFPVEVRKILPSDIQGILAKLAVKLRRHGYRVSSDESSRSLYGIRGRWSPVGTVLFHLSFIGLTLGIGLSLYTSFYGEILVTEGQTFTGEQSFYTRPTQKELAKQVNKLPEVSFRLDRVQPEFWEDKLLFTDLLADISYPVPDLGEFYTLRLNLPFYYQGTLIELKGFGYSPYYQVLNKQGKVVSESFVTLTIFPSGSEDSFKIPGLPYEVHVLMWSDPGQKGNKIINRSHNLTQPLYHVYILKGSQNKLVYEGNLRSGDLARFEGYTLSFPDIRYNGEFRMIRNSGIPVIFGSFLLGCLGLVIRLFLYRKELVALVVEEGEDTVLYLLGRSDYYKSLLQRQLEDLSAKL